MLKSPGTLKTYFWVGLGPWNWFNWLEMEPAYGTLKQSYLLVPGCSQSPSSTALKKRYINPPNFQNWGFWNCLDFCYFWSLHVQQFIGFSSVQFSCSVVSDSLRPHESQHSRLPYPSPTPGVYSNSCPSSRWCHTAISSPSPPALNLSQQQGLFQWVSSLHQVAKVLELQQQSFQ